MDARIRDQVRRLLREAEMAVDPKENGLMDRGDYVKIVKKFIDTTGTLLGMMEELRSAQEEFGSRLRRNPKPDDDGQARWQ